MILIEVEKAVATTPDLRTVPFFLALEEWVAAVLPTGEYFFSWIVEPSVIMGRNQDAAAEIDADYCREKGIGVYRRRSGGGCVYADRDNIMLSFILPGADVESNFGNALGRVAAFLRSLGIEAEVTGRNDVLVHGRKVSGSAFYRLPGRSIVHSTMLVDTNMQHMLNAITPSQSKLASHGVQSVEGRITTLSKHIPGITPETLSAAAASFFTDSAYTLTKADIEAVKTLMPRHHTLIPPAQPLKS